MFFFFFHFRTSYFSITYLIFFGKLHSHIHSLVIHKDQKTNNNHIITTEITTFFTEKLALQNDPIWNLAYCNCDFRAAEIYIKHI